VIRHSGLLTPSPVFGPTRLPRCAPLAEAIRAGLGGERFEDAKDWKVAIGRKIFAHKLLISLAAEKLGCEGPWNPDTFGGYNDTICKKWFRDKLKFKIIK